MSSCALYDDMMEKIGSLTKYYRNSLTYLVFIRQTEDSYRFPISLPQQVHPIVTGIQAFYRSVQTIKVEVGYFWQAGLFTGLKIHPHILPLSEAYSDNLFQNIASWDSRIISLAFIRVIVHKTNEDEVDVCDCHLCEE